MSLKKLKTATELAQIRNALGEKGRRMVFTNGCFDILHAGHVRYLQQARELGDALVVALNGDESVRQLKGPGRPVNGETDRAEVLCALGCIDYVTIFSEARVTGLLRLVKPQIYTKGGDYTPDSMNAEEMEVLKEIGTEVKILPLVPGRSTTGLLNKIETGKQENRK